MDTAPGISVHLHQPNVPRSGGERCHVLSFPNVLAPAALLPAGGKNDLRMTAIMLLICARQFLFLYQFVSLFIEDIENMDHLIRRLIAAIRKVSLNNGALPFGMPLGFQKFTVV